jgi:superfamily II DNA or RNA helicase
VIFDEIHHCAGSNIDNANAWGEQIILYIQDKAKYTLALTGTPWRSDAAPIVISNDMHPSNKISCDYVYGLAEAIKDNVCRVPQIIAVDNNNISVIENEETITFSSFKCLLSQSIIPYQEIIENEKVIKYVISSAQKKLGSIRTKSSDAAGLIVASSVEHAKQIRTLMKACFNEDAVVVTYRENEPTNIIQHFRQILGRILRMTNSKNQEAIMYMPAEPKLLEYAYRVKQDVPFEADVVKFEKMKTVAQDEIEDKDVGLLTFDNTTTSPSKINLKLSEFIHVIDNEMSDEVSETADEHFLTSSYEKVVNIFGQFKQESIALGLSELR